MDKEEKSDFLTAMYKYRLIFMKGRPYGEISQAEYFILKSIRQFTVTRQKEGELFEGAMVSELAERMGTTMPAASKLLRIMEGKGYVNRVTCRNDHRVIYFLLTEHGNQVLMEAKKHKQQVVANIAAEMGEADLEQFTKLLIRLCEIMKKELEL